MKTEDRDDNDDEAGEGGTERELSRQQSGEQRVKARETLRENRAGRLSEDSNYEPRADQEAVGLGQEGALR